MLLTPSLESARKTSLTVFLAALVPGLAVWLTPGAEPFYLWIFGIYHPLVAHVAAGLLVHSMLRDRPTDAPRPGPERALLIAAIVTSITFVIVLLTSGVNWLD
jgi:hypothetical protein